LQLHLDGSREIRAERRTVFERLTTPAFLAKSLPDAEDVHVVGNDRLEAKMKMRIAVVSSTLSVKMTITEMVPESRAKLLAVASGSGSVMTINSVFELKGEMPTTMEWSADAEITGVMSGLGSTFLKTYAAKKVSEIFDGITKSIEQG
jgi:carbon monoxide dehydrogenase subunit G